jgi:hypothetical protein
MSSKPIYPHVPYFYVIEHVTSGKKYAGCRYAKGCNPVEFMQHGGYYTSSSTVKQIIDEEGLKSFKIIEIKTDIGDVYEYETKFLVENDCAASEQWLNQHNNIGMALGTEEFKAAMFTKHGVENSMHSEECKRKHRQTMLKNHGVEYPGQSEEAKEKLRQTMLKNYGVENPMQSEIVKEKYRQTCLKNYGVENAGQAKEQRERASRFRRESFNLKINKEILNGDFSRFVYLYDTVDHVFLMGVEKSLNRGLRTNRYIAIASNRSGSKKYIDVLTGKTYRIDLAKFSTELPSSLLVSIKCAASTALTKV